MAIEFDLEHEPIDTEDECIEYEPISDADLERGVSPHTVITDLFPSLNGGW